MKFMFSELFNLAKNYIQCLLGPGAGPDGAMAPASEFGPGPTLQNVKIIGILMSIIKFYYSKMNIHCLLAGKAL